MHVEASESLPVATKSCQPTHQTLHPPRTHPRHTLQLTEAPNALRVLHLGVQGLVVVVVGMLEPEPQPFLGIILLLGAAALSGLLLLDESS